MFKGGIIKKCICNHISIFCEYGGKIAFSGFLWWVAFYLRSPLSYKISSLALHIKTKQLDKFVAKNYKKIIDDCKSLTFANDAIEKRIWFFWWQGAEDMPPLVQACYRQLTRHNDGVILISKNNISDYLEISCVILDKVETRILTPTNLSDIVRNLLLAKYGGLWIDATVWVAGNVFNGTFDKLPFFSPNGKVTFNPHNICFWTSGKYNWSTWCMYAGKKNMQLFTFVGKMLYAVAEDKKCFPDYVFMDYLINFACCNFPETNRVIGLSQGIMGEMRNAMADILNKKYDEDILHKLTTNDLFFKLSYRSSKKLITQDGSCTFYAMLLENKI